ncbi:hypothetical protein Peur_038359 [Populus x canadensis]
MDDWLWKDCFFFCRLVRSIARSLCLFCLKGLVHMYNLCNLMVYLWIGQFLFEKLQLLNRRSFYFC